MSRPLPPRAQVGVCLAVLAAASMWCYVYLVLVPHQRAEAAARAVPRGNLSDLYPRWLGARELLLHGRDPYSPEVTRDIQQGYYGRALDPNRPGDPKDQQGFAYPVYVVFLLAPTVRLPFAVVQIGFRWLLVLLTIISVPLWLKALGQRVSPLAVVIWVVFVLGSFPAVQGIKLQQLTLLVCTLLAGAFAAIAAGHLVIAGVLLAVATIKPQLVAIALVWLFAWTLADWRNRRGLFRGFAITLLLLLGASSFVLPGWVSRFRSAAADYIRYTGGGRSLLDVLLTPLPGKIAAICVVIGLAVLCWRWLRHPASNGNFGVIFSIVLAGTLVVIPTYAPYNQLLLLPALMVVVAEAPRHWESSKVLRVLVSLMWLCVAWPWITAAMLDVALLIYPASRVQNAWQIPLFASLVTPLAVLGATATLGVQMIQRTLDTRHS